MGFGSGQVAFVGDLPATPDRARALSWSLAVLAIASCGVVLTTSSQLVNGTSGDATATALCLAYLLTTAVTLMIPWARFDESWAIGAVAVPIVFTASLVAITGGGSSPYAALYAPLLVIVGWHLSLRDALVAPVIVAATELWRAGLASGPGSVAQLAISLPLYAALAVLAWLAARYVRGTLIELRHEQVRFATLVDTMRTLGAEPERDILDELREALRRMLQADVQRIDFDIAAPPERTFEPGRTSATTASVVVAGQTHLYGVMRLSGPLLSSHDLRIATLLADEAGRIADARRSAGTGARREGSSTSG